MANDLLSYFRNKDPYLNLVTGLYETPQALAAGTAWRNELSSKHNALLPSNRINRLWQSGSSPQKWSTPGADQNKWLNSIAYSTQTIPGLEPAVSEIQNRILPTLGGASSAAQKPIDYMAEISPRVSGFAKEEAEAIGKTFRELPKKAESDISEFEKKAQETTDRSVAGIMGVGTDFLSQIKNILSGGRAEQESLIGKTQDEYRQALGARLTDAIKSAHDIYSSELNSARLAGQAWQRAMAQAGRNVGTFAGLALTGQLAPVLANYMTARDNRIASARDTYNLGNMDQILRFGGLRQSLMDRILGMDFAARGRASDIALRAADFEAARRAAIDEAVRSSRERALYNIPRTQADLGGLRGNLLMGGAAADISRMNLLNQLANSQANQIASYIDLFKAATDTNKINPAIPGYYQSLRGNLPTPPSFEPPSYYDYINPNLDNYLGEKANALFSEAGGKQSTNNGPQPVNPKNSQIGTYQGKPLINYGYSASRPGEVYVWGNSVPEGYWLDLYGPEEMSILKETPEIWPDMIPYMYEQQ